VLARAHGQEEALGVLERPAGCSYGPQIMGALREVGPDLVRRLGTPTPGDAALTRIPRRVLKGAALREALTVVADFMDLNSPSMVGHSRPPPHMRRRRRHGRAGLVRRQGAGSPSLLLRRALWRLSARVEKSCNGVRDGQ